MDLTPSQLDPIESDVDKISRIAVIPRILNVICESTGMGFCVVARVTDTRWVACAVKDTISYGMTPGCELDIKTTICDQIRDAKKAVIIEDVSGDTFYRDHLTPAMYGFRSYISVPIFKDTGEFFGTLCAIDPDPRRINNTAVSETFALFADLIGVHLSMQDRLQSTESELLDEREQGKLREQFIAVLGHDLRNPLAAINSSASYLSQSLVDSKPKLAAAMIVRSVGRMVNLVNNLTDFAQARLGGGFRVEVDSVNQLAVELEHVISEMRQAWPNQTVDVEIDLNHPVQVDGPRIAQMVSNLLANALSHGSIRRPVLMRATSSPNGLVISVANAGKPIEAGRLVDLFKPFVRGHSAATSSGLGLGLFIVKEIVRAHGGTVEVSSGLEETCFTARIPNTGPNGPTSMTFIPSNGGSE